MRVLLLIAYIMFVHVTHAQLYVTRDASVQFFSKTPLEDIKAVNNQAATVLDVEKHTVIINCLVKGFVFKKALMQDHFNENYAESDKYPSAGFSGSYTGDIDLNKEGVYPIVVTGDLKFHGVTKPMKVAASAEVKNGQLICKTAFNVKPEDFNIKIPSLVKDKIADQITVTVNAICKRR